MADSHYNHPVLPHCRDDRLLRAGTNMSHKEDLLRAAAIAEFQADDFALASRLRAAIAKAEAMSKDTAAETESNAKLAERPTDNVPAASMSPPAVPSEEWLALARARMAVHDRYVNRCPHEWYQGRCIHCDVAAEGCVVDDAVRYRKVRSMLRAETLSTFFAAHRWPSGTDKSVSNDEFDSAIDAAPGGEDG